MSLHKFIPDEEIPSPLKKRLVFGDRKQIEALNDMETDISNMDIVRAEIDSEKLKRFDVTIEYGGTQEIRVLATDEDDAKEKAEEEAHYDPSDMEIDSVYARKIKS